MKCCGSEMYRNLNNYHCPKCGKRIYYPTKCPKCHNALFINNDNVHCAKCGYRKYIR